MARTVPGVDSDAYHDAYHRYAAAIWAFRVIVRQDIGETPFEPADFGHSEWSERNECEICAAATEAASTPRSAPVDHDRAASATYLAWCNGA